MKNTGGPRVSQSYADLVDMCVEVLSTKPGHEATEESIHRLMGGSIARVRAALAMLVQQGQIAIVDEEVEEVAQVEETFQFARKLALAS